MCLPPTTTPYPVSYTGSQSTPFPSPDNISAFSLEIESGLSRFISGFLKLYAVVVSVVISFLPKNLGLKIFTEETLFATVVLRLFQVFFLQNYISQWPPFLPTFCFCLVPVQTTGFCCPKTFMFTTVLFLFLLLFYNLRSNWLRGTVGILHFGLYGDNEDIKKCFPDDLRSSLDTCKKW